MSDLIQDNYIFLNENHKSKEDTLAFIAKKAKEYNICDDEKGLLTDLLNRKKNFLQACKMDLLFHMHVVLM